MRRLNAVRESACSEPRFLAGHSGTPSGSVRLLAEGITGLKDRVDTLGGTISLSSPAGAGASG
jgi:hypothetical protein